ncbi:hypothetical protein [Fimbriiglobus ruber]|uniref:hypothetical protein n=1 Tax=Fimbriiglobus ruber TaxID=1908690 RepID=UPI000B4AC137|nr:hypothetical protein [Fimbriiglobus ruber]
MSTSLRDVLKQKSALYAAEAEKNKLVIEEWRAAVDKLFNQLCDWLVVADPDRIIHHEYSQFGVTEPGLGRYQISRLDLRALGKWVGLIPKARKTIKRATPQQTGAPEQATGRVDITDESRRFVLYRFTQEAADTWFIDDTTTNNGLQPLTSERFEAALLSYFQ